MLTLVHPPRSGQGGDPPKRRRRGRSSSLLLTEEEQRHLVAALRGLRARMGTWKRVTEAMRVSEKSITNVVCGSKRGGPALLLLAARVGHTTVERILSAPVAANRCPSCGATRGAP